jgi:ribonucleoside-diphosphate reductase subunit M2
MSNSKFTYFPRDAKLTKFQDKLDSTFWTAEEVDYTADKFQMTDLENLSKRNGKERIGNSMITSEQAKNLIIFIKNILCLFAQLDGVVIENLLKHFTEEVSEGEKEIEGFYIAQAHNELMHSKSYSVQVETLVSDAEERQEIYTASLKYPAVSSIQDWTLKWFDAELPIMERLIAFCCVEGIVFTSGFVAIYRLKEWGLFTEGLCRANEFISKDEAVHTAAGIEFFLHKAAKGYPRPTQERVYEIIQDSVDLASKFTDEAVKPELVGLEREDMKEYIKVTANKILVDLGYDKKYDATSPFEWMNKICLFNISNMFETRVTEYQRPSENLDVSGDSEEW